MIDPNRVHIIDCGFFTQKRTIEMPKRNFSLILGSAGTAKSTNLVSHLIEYISKGDSVYVMTPTHAVKSTIKSIIEDHYSGLIEDVKYKYMALSSVHVLSDSFNGENVIMIDEVGLTNSSHLYSIFHQTRNINATIIMYGDAKQLNPVNGASPLEKLLRINITGPYWKSIRSEYKFESNKLVAPAEWNIDEEIQLTILKDNYRLSSNTNFSDYNTDFFQDALRNVIQKEDYSDELREAVASKKFIITVTHAQGKQIDHTLSNYYDVKKSAYFKRIGTDIYLNDDHENYNELKKKFNFIEDWNKRKSDEFEYSFYSTVHKAQGATVDDVAFFIGNDRVLKHMYTFPLFYTALSRARLTVVLLGKKDSFIQMYDANPSQKKAANLDIVNHKAIIKLFDYLQQSDRAHTFHEVTHYYENFYKDMLIELNTLDNNMLDEIGLKKAFKDYTYDKIIIGFGVENPRNYHKLFYENNLLELNHESHLNKGSIQKYILSLTSDEQEQLSADLKDRHFKSEKFQKKYQNYTKEQLRKANDKIIRNNNN